MLILQIGERPLRRDQDSRELEGKGFHRETTDTLEEAISFIELYEFDLIVADLDNPAMPGIDMIREIRAVSHIPVIGITTSIDPRLKIAALDMGADDVLTQLCGVDEFLARVRAVVRRRCGYVDSSLSSGRLNISLAQRMASVDGVPLRLGPKEFMLLELLMLKRGTAVSKAACMTHLYGTDEFPEAKTIDVVLCRLRKRLAPQGLSDIIESVWGYGFKLKDTDADRTAPRAPATLRRRALATA